MQGHTQSSESIWTAFNNATTAYSRALKYLLRISWKRAERADAFAVVGTSLVNGTQVVQGLSDVLTGTDSFQYFDETSRLVRFEYDRQIQEPLGGIAMALGDLVLENVDGRFTPNQNGTIGTAILPNRPLQMYIGFLVGVIEKVIPIFKGLTLTPRQDYKDGTVAMSCIDYIRYLNEAPLESEVYQNQRSDQIIEDILTSLGFGSSEYDLDEGLNTIGFAWFEKGQTAGERIRKIAEAEEGLFYQDEGGILRFENRRHFSVSPNNLSVWDFDLDDIIQWEDDNSTPVINRAIVKAKPRQIQLTTEVWRNITELELAFGESAVVWANFSDPVTSITAPAETTDYTAFTGSGETGTDVTTGIDITTDLFTTAVKLTITNNSGATAYVPFLRLRGTPAIVTQEIAQVFQDDDSILKYNQNQVEIENDFIDDPDFAYYIARAIVRKYKEPQQRIKIMVQAVPQIQLRDKVRVYDRNASMYRSFRVMRIQGELADGLHTQQITLREVTDQEADAWAIVGVTAVEAQNEFVGQ